MMLQRTNLTTINRLLDVLTQLDVFDPFTVEVHIGPGLMYYVLPELLDELRSLCPPGTEVGIDSVGSSFTYRCSNFVVDNDLGNGFSIHINGGLVVDYCSPGSTYAP